MHLDIEKNKYRIRCMRRPLACPAQANQWQAPRALHCSLLAMRLCPDRLCPAGALQDAARLRDRLRELQPPPPPPPPPPPAVPRAPAFDPTATTASECVTDGVRVTCRSFFVPHQSRPAAGSYFFACEAPRLGAGKCGARGGGARRAQAWVLPGKLASCRFTGARLRGPPSGMR